MSVCAIILAAGEGNRFGAKKSKLFFRINSQPIIYYCLKALSRHPLVKDIIVVVNSRNEQAISRLIKNKRVKKVSCITRGGRRRQDSVWRGLQEVGNKPGLVLIHDAARPFVDSGTIFAVIKAAEKWGAAIAGVPVKATIKEATAQFVVKRTLERNRLWEIQTPQAFRRDLLLRAYKRFGNIEVTDDAMLIERLRRKVHVVLGSYKNIKITTPEDLEIAKAFVERPVVATPSAARGKQSRF